ncbi:hypothetical protein HA402_011882 [Bradysia odoriphaga]|nr:hypothetical protein HA402_011882 [Bradysia odoriphaga]
MNSILITLSTVVVIAYAQHLPAAQYPAGVDPSLCPGYPNCDNALLHNAKQQPAWSQPQPQWSAPAQNWNIQPSTWNYQVPQWQQPAAIYERVSNDLSSGGDKYPAGVDPQSCPNYPFCDLNDFARSAPVVAPLPGWTERLYPAGVSPKECPNFPYCH